jgi:hypothetical protein
VRPLRPTAIVLFVGAGAGCFSPDYGSPSFACGKGSQCPYGYECAIDGLCYQAGTSPLDAPGSPDARDGSTIDAMVIPRVDAAPCDGDCEPDAMVTEECPGEQDAIVDITHSAGSYTGTTIGASDDDTPLCATSAAADVVHRFVLPGRASVTFSLCGGADWDTVLDLKDSCADGAAALTCDDDTTCADTFVVQSTVTADLDPGTYYLFVDGYSTSVGAYTLFIGGIIQNDAPCDPEQVGGSFLHCENGHQCEDDGSGFACR